MLQSRKRHHHCDCIRDCNWEYDHNKDIVSPMFTNIDDLIDFVKEQRGSSCSYGYIYVFYGVLNGMSYGDTHYFFKDSFNHIVTRTTTERIGGSSFYLIPHLDRTTTTYFNNPYEGKTSIYNEDNSKIAGNVSGGTINGIYNFLEKLTDENYSDNYKILGYRWQNCAASLRQTELLLHVDPHIIQIGIGATSDFSSSCQKTHIVSYTGYNIAPTKIERKVVWVGRPTVYVSYQSGYTNWHRDVYYNGQTAVTYEGNLAEMTLDDNSIYSIDDVPGTKLGEVWSAVRYNGGMTYRNFDASFTDIIPHNSLKHIDRGSIQGNKTREEVVEMINNGELQVSDPSEADLEADLGPINFESYLATRHCEMLFYEE